MSDPQHRADVAALQAARLRGFQLIAVVACLLGVGLGAIDALWGISMAAALTGLLVFLTFIWTRVTPERTKAGMYITLYGSTLGLAIASSFELPDAATLPFFIALVFLAGSYLVGVRAALTVTIVASVSILVCYLGFAWAAAVGLVPSTGAAVVDSADAPELLIMSLRRIVFLFAVFGVAAAARRTLDDQLRVVQDREEVIAAQAVELRASESQFLILAESVPVGILETDSHGHAVFVNQAWCELVATSRQAGLGDGWHALIYPDDLPKILELMPTEPPLAEHSTLPELPDEVFRLRRADGELRWISCRVAPLPTDDGAVKGHILAVIDVTSQRTASDQLNHLATHDPMTGVLNRGAFELEVGATLARAERYAARCALLYTDIDQFKAINDTHGHAVGDAALDTVVRRLQATLREVDTVGRLGGDEFGILLDQVRSPDNADLTIRRIEAAFNELMVVDGKTSFTLRLSIGAAVYPDDGTNFDDLARIADAAIYQQEKRHESLEK